MNFRGRTTCCRLFGACFIVDDPRPASIGRFELNNANRRTPMKTLEMFWKRSSDGSNRQGLFVKISSRCMLLKRRAARLTSFGRPGVHIEKSQAGNACQNQIVRAPLHSLRALKRALHRETADSQQASHYASGWTQLADTTTLWPFSFFTHFVALSSPIPQPSTPRESSSLLIPSEHSLDMT